MLDLYYKYHMQHVLHVHTLHNLFLIGTMDTSMYFYK